MTARLVVVVTGSSVLAALIAAVAFGVGHSIQGERSMVLSLIAPGMHALVRVTGSQLAQAHAR